MIRLLPTSRQKYARWIAAEKLDSVACTGNHFGVYASTSCPGLNAVDTIQYTGKTINAKTTSATAFVPMRPARRRRPRRTRSAVVGATGVGASDVTELTT